MMHIHALQKEKNIVLHDQPIERVACEGGFYDIDFAEYERIAKTNKFEINYDVLSNLSTNNESIRKLTDEFLTYYAEPLFDAINEIINRYKYRNVFRNPISDAIQSPELRAKISYYIAYQYLRTDYFRMFMTEIMLMNDSELTRNKEVLDIKLIKSILQMRTLFNFTFIDKMAKAIYSGIWTLISNNTCWPYYTSDNPIVVIQDTSKDIKIFSDVLMITYPLLPSLMLLITSPKLSLGFQNYNNCLMDATESSIFYMNKQRLLFSKRFIYSNDDSFTQANSMNIHKNVSIKDLMEEFYHT